MQESFQYFSMRFDVFFKNTYTEVKKFFGLEQHDESRKRRRRETMSEEAVVAEGESRLSFVSKLYFMAILFSFCVMDLAILSCFVSSKILCFVLLICV